MRATPFPLAPATAMTSVAPAHAADFLLRLARAQVPGGLTCLVHQICGLPVTHPYDSLGEKQQATVQAVIETAAGRIATHLREGKLSLAERDLLHSFLPSKTREPFALLAPACAPFVEGEGQYAKFHNATTSLLKMPPTPLAEAVNEEVFCAMARSLGASSMSLLFDFTRQERALAEVSKTSIFHFLPGYRQYCEKLPPSPRVHAANACGMLYALLLQAAAFYEDEDERLSEKLYALAMMIKKEVIDRLREARRTVEVHGEEPAHTTKIILQVATGVLRSELESDDAVSLRAAFAVPAFKLVRNRLRNAPLHAETKLYSVHSAAAIIASSFEAVGTTVAPDFCLAVVLGSVVLCRNEGFVWLDQRPTQNFSNFLLQIPSTQSRTPLVTHRSGGIAKKPRLRHGPRRKPPFTAQHAALGSLLLATDEAVGRGNGGVKQREMQLLAAAAMPRPPVLGVAGDQACLQLVAKARAATLVAPDLLDFTRAAATAVAAQDGRLSPATTLRRVTRRIEEGVVSAAADAQDTILAAPPRAAAVVKGLVHRAGALAKVFEDEDSATWTVLAKAL